MASRRVPEEYDPKLVALRSIGEGNTVNWDDSVIGPISVPGDIQKEADFLFSGASPAGPSSGERLNPDQAFERLARGYRDSSRELNKNLDRARRESRIFFTLLCIFASLAFLTLLATNVAVLMGGMKASAVGIPCGVVSGAVATIFFRKDHELRSVLSAYTQQIRAHCEVLAMAEIAETIADQRERDRMKRAIICRALGVTFRKADAPPPTKDGT